ncbi:MAG: hypothetical protein A2201_00140 [Alicyclobacillus sp. RIFOXYA1_FULL_53_8]|nr:MAG: hypothetical protein A2201_00140 [Alicyclobacillus sp. RIFOXYA1_FULL_53_8]
MVVGWTLGLLAVLFLGYSVLPNIFTRVLQWGVIRHLEPTPAIALTFDDGPDATYTPRLLDVLSEYKIPATFFVIAQKAIENPDIVERMIREGHQVEVHGFTHALVPMLGPSTTLKQIAGSARQLKQHFGLQTHFYRPTWGLLNLASLIYTMARKSHRLVTWSIMVGDWRVVPHDGLLERIERELHPGAIVVLHDSDSSFGAERGAPNQVIALIPPLAELVRKQGYEFCLLEGRL